MKTLIDRIQKDISKLQDAVQKESNDLLEKIKKLDVKENLDATKKELFKVLSAKLKKLEPTYETFMNEVRKNAKKAGVDIDKLEKSLKKTAKDVGSRINAKAKKKVKKKTPMPKKKTTTRKVGTKRTQTITK